MERTIYFSTPSHKVSAPVYSSIFQHRRKTSVKCHKLATLFFVQKPLLSSPWLAYTHHSTLTTEQPARGERRTTIPYLLTPISEQAKAFLAEKAPNDENHTYCERGLVIEHTFLEDWEEYVKEEGLRLDIDFTLEHWS